MKFTKIQGAGNDFIVLKPGKIDIDFSELARKMCDRHHGIGADGVILALPSKAANLRMRIFNSDGSEAEMCGNGLRCLAKYAVLNKLVKSRAPQITVETIPGIRNINLGYQGSRLNQIQAGIGIPIFAAREIPLDLQAEGPQIQGAGPVLDYPLMIDSYRLLLNFVSMGNPHAVYFINQSLAEYPLTEIGPKIEHHALFPRHINFEIARVINRDKIEMRVWERGAGETLACGTGACAVAVAAQLHNYVNRIVDIMLPGGILNIEWDGRGEVFMSGPAEVVFTGDWPAA
jgi:diaminopimelate epimerase